MIEESGKPVALSVADTPDAWPWQPGASHNFYNALPDLPRYAAAQE
jgi:hypothetical protein